MLFRTKWKPLLGMKFKVHRLHLELGSQKTGNSSVGASAGSGPHSRPRSVSLCGLGPGAWPAPPPSSTCRLRRRCDPLWWVLKGGTWQPERVLGVGPDAEGGPTTARRLREHGPISDSEPDGHSEDSSEQAGHWRPMVYDTIHVPR